MQWKCCAYECRGVNGDISVLINELIVQNETLWSFYISVKAYIYFCSWRCVWMNQVSVCTWSTPCNWEWSSRQLTDNAEWHIQKVFHTPWFFHNFGQSFITSPHIRSSFCSSTLPSPISLPIDLTQIHFSRKEVLIPKFFLFTWLF